MAKINGKYTATAPGMIGDDSGFFVNPKDIAANLIGTLVSFAPGPLLSRLSLDDVMVELFPAAHDVLSEFAKQYPEHSHPYLGSNEEPHRRVCVSCNRKDLLGMIDRIIGRCPKIQQFNMRSTELDAGIDSPDARDDDSSQINVVTRDGGPLPENDFVDLGALANQTANVIVMDSQLTHDGLISLSDLRRKEED